MWAFEMIPPDWQSKGNDLIWLAAFVGACAVLITTFWRMKWIRRLVIWLWRRTWGRDEHGVFLTPTVRRTRSIQEAIQPKLDDQTRTFVAEMARGQQETKLAMSTMSDQNTRDHAKVQTGLADVVQRLTAVETTTASLEERLGAVEAALMGVPK